MVQSQMKHKLAFSFCVAVIWFLGGWLGFLASDREIPTIIYSAEPFNSIVKPGTDLKIEYVVRRNRSCAVTVDRFILDAQKVRFPLDDINVGAGLRLGEDRFFQPIKIPSEASPGPATYKTISTYTCNPIQRLWPIPGGERDVHFAIE